MAHSTSIRDLPAPAAVNKSGWPWTQDCPQLAETAQNGKQWPRITIVTPNYNYGRFIEETIRSVLLQGYPNLEYIIMDSCSTDESVRIIQRYERWLAYWASEKDRGQSDAINKGFARASGQVFAWLNSDDILNPGALKSVGSYWAGEPACHMLAGDGAIVNPQSGKQEYYIKGGRYSFNDLLEYHRNKYLPQSSVFFSNEAFKKAGALRISLNYSMDLDLWLKTSLAYPIHYLPICLSSMKHHSDAKTWKDNEPAMKEVAQVIRGYLDKVGPLRRLYIRGGLALLYAEAVCRQGLNIYFHGDTIEAKRVLSKALGITPFIIFSRNCLRLLLRIVLPGGIKKVIFKNP